MILNIVGIIKKARQEKTINTVLKDWDKRFLKL